MREVLILFILCVTGCGVIPGQDTHSYQMKVASLGDAFSFAPKITCDGTVQVSPGAQQVAANADQVYSASGKSCQFEIDPGQGNDPYAYIGVIISQDGSTASTQTMSGRDTAKGWQL